jgi:hypothetical protein
MGLTRPGFTDDIGALPEDFNLAVSCFFVTFVLFQPLSAAVGWCLGPRHWIPIMMVRPHRDSCRSAADVDSIHKPFLTTQN